MLGLKTLHMSAPTQAQSTQAQERCNATGFLFLLLFFIALRCRMTMQSWNNTQNVKRTRKASYCIPGVLALFTLLALASHTPTPTPHLTLKHPHNLFLQTHRTQAGNRFPNQSSFRALEKGEIACLVRGASPSSLQQLGPPACVCKCDTKHGHNKGKSTEASASARPSSSWRRWRAAPSLVGEAGGGIFTTIIDLLPFHRPRWSWSHHTHATRKELLVLVVLVVSSSSKRRIPSLICIL